MKLFYKIFYNIDWMAKDVLSGKISRRALIYGIFGLIVFIFASYLGGLESYSAKDWSFLKEVEAFLWIALYPVYLYLIWCNLTLISIVYYFLSLLIFFLRYVGFLLVYHFSMFILILFVGAFGNVKNSDFDGVDIVFNYIAGVYFYSLILCLFYKIKTFSTKKEKSLS